MIEKSQAEKAAVVVLSYIGDLDPTWAERFAIMMSEHQWTPLQAIGSCAAQVLEAGTHTVIPQHVFFEPGAQPAQMSEGLTYPCPVCHKPFRPSYPGQPLCSNECAAKFYKKK